MSESGHSRDEVPFAAHVDLLRSFLSRRDEIVERIQGLLNAQRKPPQYLHDRHLLERHFEDCFFAAGATPEQARLRGQLQEAHWSHGFRARETPGVYNDIVHPAEMMRRVFHLWTATRWPGRNGRVRYAHTLFNVYLLRQIALLSMRVWDAGASQAGERLAQIQGILDALLAGAPPDQPVMLRDARWLSTVAQSPATEELVPYFDVAGRIAASFSDDDRIEVQQAVVRTAGGHLRSYLHYYVAQKGMRLDDERLAVIARKSDALDFSLLIHALAPLLEAYERAAHDGDRDQRLELADAICQGVSPDPELLIERVDLLAAYSMVEHLFTATDRDGKVAYTPLGQRHVELLDDYAARIGRVAQSLHEDCAQFRPVEGAYSPYGLLFGFSSNLLEHMALKAVQPEAETRFSIEDAFRAGGADKLAWVNGWRQLPHVDPQIAKLYGYPHEFAAATFARVEQSLRRRAAEGAPARTGRLFVVPESDAQPDQSALPDLPIRYVVSSDGQLVAAQKAEAYDAAELEDDRLQGFFLVSYESPGGWVAITKDCLTEVLAAGRDVRIAGLPAAAVATLRLMCRDLVVLPDSLSAPPAPADSTPRSSSA